MSMTIAEAREEIKGAYQKADEIIKKYDGGLITNNEDDAEVKRLLGEVDGLEEKLAALSEAERNGERVKRGLLDYMRPANGHRHPESGAGEGEQKRMTAGELFTGSQDYLSAKNNGLFNHHSNRVQMTVALPEGQSLLRKALVYSGTGVGGPTIQRDRLPGLYEILQREIRITDLVPTSSTDSDTIEYVKEKTFTNNAAMVAEATATTGTSGLKPESVLEFETATATVKTLAHWIPVTNKMLADSRGIRGIIDNRLLLGLDLELEDQIIAGGGTGEDFTGILNAGIQTQAAGTDSVLDRIYKAIVLVRVVGFSRPQAIVIHPNDFSAIRLARENVSTGTLGNYLMGPPSQAGAVTIWGLPVVESQAITENTALVGDFQMGCMLFDREQAQIRVGTIDDQFVRNLQTVLAELRAAFVVFRPNSFCQVTGV